MADLKVRCMMNASTQKRKKKHKTMVNVLNATGPSHTTFTATTLHTDGTNPSTT